MRNISARRGPIERERELLDFARSYLSDAFPNPDREGCPQADSLRILARQPMQSDKSISNHLTCCSPCFRAYMAHLGHARHEAVRSERIRRATWIRHSLITASVLGLIISIWVLFPRHHNAPSLAPRTRISTATPTPVPPTVMYVPAVLDLTDTSPVRGVHEDKVRRSPQVLPSSPLGDLKLLLPFGSGEELYSLRLSSKGHVVWSKSAQARLENGQMTLRMHTDLGSVLTGDYDLIVLSKELRLTVPVRVKSTSRDK
jgi:hypothetical protein